MKHTKEGHSLVLPPIANPPDGQSAVDRLIAFKKDVKDHLLRYHGSAPVDYKCPVTKRLVKVCRDPEHDMNYYCVCRKELLLRTSVKRHFTHCKLALATIASSEPLLTVFNPPPRTNEEGLSAEVQFGLDPDYKPEVASGDEFDGDDDGDGGDDGGDDDVDVDVDVDVDGGEGGDDGGDVDVAEGAIEDKENDNVGRRENKADMDKFTGEGQELRVMHHLLQQLQREQRALKEDQRALKEEQRALKDEQQALKEDRRTLKMDQQLFEQRMDVYVKNMLSVQDQQFDTISRCQKQFHSIMEERIDTTIECQEESRQNIFEVMQQLLDNQSDFTKTLLNDRVTRMNYRFELIEQSLGLIRDNQQKLRHQFQPEHHRLEDGHAEQRRRATPPQRQPQYINALAGQSRPLHQGHQQEDVNVWNQPPRARNQDTP
ncbi:hypothetical protein BGX21_000063 [Mortierella sp. AD011]|nr:hypothetical protein BGX20_009994 [Mortierella sp. AD010]KAF9401963.1 hypothetical protein BGX21_000063 [Mortierella sp. AD011]